MKHLTAQVALSLSFILMFSFGFSKSILLSEALQKKMVKVSFVSANKTLDKNTSLYWGSCMKINLQNLTSGAITIQLEPGLFLTSDSMTQRMMVVDNQQLALTPKGSKKATINAFCTQMHKDSPSQDIAFNPSGNAQGDLLLLANYITKRKYSSYAVQNAIWTITDNNDPSSIYADNQSETDSLLHFVYSLKKIPFQSKANKIVRVEQKTTNGKFKFDFGNKDGGLYSIYLYNANGELVQEFSKNFDYPHHDKITVSYRFQSSITSGTYFVRVVRNGNETVKNFPIQVE
jgi:hypothetical protein